MGEKDREENNKGPNMPVGETETKLTRKIKQPKERRE